MADRVDFVKSHKASSHLHDPGRRKPTSTDNLSGKHSAYSGSTRRFLHDPRDVGPKPNYTDYVLSDGRRKTAADMRSMTVHEKHKLFMSWYARARDKPAAPDPKSCPSDLDILRANHKFIRSEEDDDGTWESKLAKRYYEKLYKEYVIADLAGYKKGQVGFRWRTEPEVLQGTVCIGFIRDGH